MHLDDCCPDLDITEINCSFSSQGCEGPTIHPAISIEAAHCLKDKSCQYLREEGLCERVQARTQNSTGGGPPSIQALCP